MKKLWMSFAAFLMATTLVACSKPLEEAPEAPVETQKGETEVVEPAKKETLTIGVMGSIDAVPLAIAEELGYFEEAGVDVKIEWFTAAKDRDAALMAGTLDGVLCDEVAISNYQNSDIDMKIITETDGYWTIVAGLESGVTSMADLAGKKVGISENTMIDYLVDDILLSNNMTVEAVEKVAIPAMPSRLEMLRNNQIDAALLPAPFNDVAIADGGMEIVTILNTEAHIAVLGMLQEAIDNKTEAVKAYLSAYNKAVEYINSTEISAYEDVIIKTVGYSEDMRGNITLPEYRTTVLPPVENVNKVLEWSKARGLLTKDITAEDVLVEVK
ncbi:MAG: ABC transporter substrate-binding protein [Turicibacter sp.]